MRIKFIPYTIRAPFVHSVIIFLLLVVMMNANASTLLGEFLQRSELVFVGTVVGVELSAAPTFTAEDPGHPFTLVTYEVEEVLAGNYAESSLVLKFSYGYTTKIGDFVDLTWLPSFSVGDQDLLFARGNNKELCPLVGCALGRFHFSEGKVTNGHGQPVGLDESGNIRMVANATSQYHLTGLFNPNDPPDNLLLDTVGFTEFIRDRINALNLNQESFSIGDFTSAIPDTPFSDVALASFDPSVGFSVYEDGVEIDRESIRSQDNRDNKIGGTFVASLDEKTSNESLSETGERTELFVNQESRSGRYVFEFSLVIILISACGIIILYFLTGKSR